MSMIVGDGLFEIRQVVDGVWVAVAAPAYKVNCNTAIVEMDDGVLIVDSHSKPSPARAIAGALPALTAKPVRWVVNTHFHWDHWQGNEPYPGAGQDVAIVTSAITRDAMLTKSLKRIQDQVRETPAEIGRLRGEIAAASSADRRAALTADLRQAEAYLAEIHVRPGYLTSWGASKGPIDCPKGATPPSRSPGPPALGDAPGDPAAPLGPARDQITRTRGRGSSRTRLIARR